MLDNNFFNLLTKILKSLNLPIACKELGLRIFEFLFF